MVADKHVVGFWNRPQMAHISAWPRQRDVSLEQYPEARLQFPICLSALEIDLFLITDASVCLLPCLFVSLLFVWYRWETPRELCVCAAIKRCRTSGVRQKIDGTRKEILVFLQLKTKNKNSKHGGDVHLHSCFISPKLHRRKNPTSIYIALIFWLTRLAVYLLQLTASATSCCLDLRGFSPVIRFSVRGEIGGGLYLIRDIPWMLDWIGSWGVWWPGRCPQLCGGGWILRMSRLRVASNGWHAWSCDAVSDVRGPAWKNTWCSLIWPEELIFPFSVGSEDIPGMTEKSSCYIGRRNLWVFSRWLEIREFVVMVSPSQTIASPQATKTSARMMCPEATRTPKPQQMNWSLKTLFKYHLLSERGAVDPVQILIACCNTDTMVVCKFGAPLWCKMIDVYRKESNNKCYVLINWRKWKWHQLTSRFTGSIWGCAQVDYPAGIESEQKLFNSWLILIHINSDERGLMTSGSARASSAFIRKGQFGRSTLSQRRAAVLSAKVRVSQYVNSRVTEKNLSLLRIQHVVRAWIPNSRAIDFSGKASSLQEPPRVLEVEAAHPVLVGISHSNDPFAHLFPLLYGSKP